MNHERLPRHGLYFARRDCFGIGRHTADGVATWVDMLAARAWVAMQSQEALQGGCQYLVLKMAANTEAVSA
jgi:hypothetical protein